MQTLLSHEVDFIDPEPLRVLTLSKYVQLKEQSDFDKDRARLPVLRETLRLQQEDGED